MVARDSSAAAAAAAAVAAVVIGLGAFGAFKMYRKAAIEAQQAEATDALKRSEAAQRKMPVDQQTEVHQDLSEGATSSSATEAQGADAKRPRPNESTMAPGPKWHLFLSHSAPRQASNPRTPHSC